MDTQPRGLILLADDDVMIRNLIRTTLEADGYSVLIAADGSEALELSRTHEGTIDLFLTDLEMPRIDGISAYRQIVTIRAGIKVVFISGGMPGKLELPPSLPFLAKPLGLAVLRAKVNEILTSKEPPGEPKVILVVHPNANHRTRIKDILTGSGYPVLLANSVEDAEVVSDSIAKIDLIVAEVVFPGRSGIQLAEYIRASDRNISTLLISHLQPDLLQNMEGFSRQPEFLPNPFTAEALLSRVRQLLA